MYLSPRSASTKRRRGCELGMYFLIAWIAPAFPRDRLSCARDAFAQRRAEFFHPVAWR